MQHFLKIVIILCASVFEPVNASTCLYEVPHPVAYSPRLHPVAHMAASRLAVYFNSRTRLRVDGRRQSVLESILQNFGCFDWFFSENGEVLTVFKVEKYLTQKLCNFVKICYNKISIRRRLNRNYFSFFIYRRLTANYPINFSLSQ